MIGIIGAMDEEVHELKVLMKDCEEYIIGETRFTLGTLNGKDVVLMKSGIGCSMAAMNTGLCISHFKVTTLINIGTAGSLKEGIRELDVVVSDKVAYHDFDLEVFGYERSFRDGNPSVFKSDPKLIETFKNMKKSVPFHIGPLVSGNQFISTQAQVDKILKNFPEAIACEMEGAAIAQVAAVFKLPFIIIRSISDHVLAEQNEEHFNAFLMQASQRSAQFCYDFVSEL